MGSIHKKKSRASVPVSRTLCLNSTQSLKMMNIMGSNPAFAEQFSDAMRKGQVLRMKKLLRGVGMKGPLS